MTTINYKELAICEVSYGIAVCIHIHVCTFNLMGPENPMCIKGSHVQCLTSRKQSFKKLLMCLEML